MFKFIKQVYIALLNFRGSLAHVAKISHHTGSIPFNKELCLARPILND